MAAEFTTIAAIQARKDEFLKALGCQFDYEEIVSGLGLGVEAGVVEYSEVVIS